MKEQMLDDMELERQRGITIKARAVTMQYALRRPEVRAESDRHAGPRRFSIRSLALAGLLRRGGAAGRCVSGRRSPNGGQRLRGDGARPDDRAGDQQDRPDARPAATKCAKRWSRRWGSTPDEVLGCSGKTGVGSEELLAAIVDRVPPPAGDPDAPLQAMVFDSHYDEFRGAITYVRMMNGTVQQGQKIRFLQARHRRTKWSNWASSAPPRAPATSWPPGKSAT